jgi:primosomal protein N' (replication factor Y)
MTENKETYLVSVAPLTKIPLSREQFFYYSVEKIIPLGSLVEVSLGKRKIQGIVLETKKDFLREGNYKIKKIENIIEENFLTSNQVELAKFISEYFFASLGIVLKFFVPSRVKARVKNELATKKDLTTKEMLLTKGQGSLINKIYHKNCSLNVFKCKTVLIGPSSSGKTESYIQLIRKAKKQHTQNQFLILVPELTHIPSISERMLEYFDASEIVILHSKLSKGLFYSNWKKIKSNEAKIIIGTRQALFAPFFNLKLVVFDEEHDISYKQWDMTPRYDARTVAEKLAKSFHAHTLLVSATPRIEDYFPAKKKKYELVKLSRLPVAPSPPKVEIIDMKKERWAKNKGPLSKKLVAEIEWTLKNGMQVLLFVNRQGMSAFSVCKKCREVLKCPQCKRALVYRKKGNYVCLHCAYQTSDFPACPNCKEMIFENIGIGTEKILRELRKNFYSARIEIADSQTMKNQTTREDIWREFSQGKIDILIGTQMITKGWDLKNIGLVGIIDADSLLSFPDLYTNENAFAHIVQASGRTGRPGSKFPGQVLIQTFQEENFVIKSAAENNFEKFFEKELGERKELDYPPFGKIIKLVFQDASKKKIEKETERIFQTFNWICEDLKNIKIYPPQDCLLSNIRGKYRRQIVIKYTNTNLAQKAGKIIQSLGPGWIVDVDPISIV